MSWMSETLQKTFCEITLGLLFFFSPSLYVFNVQAEAEKGERSPISFILNLTFVKLNYPWDIT